MRIIYVGIDSGAHGAIVALPNWSDHCWLWPLTEKIRGKEVHRNRQQILEVFGNIRSFDYSTSVCIEDPGVSGIFGAAKKSACQLYGSFTELRMACEAVFRFSPKEITSKTWVRWTGISPRKKGETKDNWKARLRNLARRKFPGVKVTVDTADALLIAGYCQHSEGVG